MMPWLFLIAFGGAAPLELLVGDVTCPSCAVSIRSVLKRAHVRLVEETLITPYARVRVRPDEGADLPGALQLLEKVGYPVFVVVPDTVVPEGAQAQRKVVGDDTLRVLPARAWLALQEQAQKEVAP